MNALSYVKSYRLDMEGTLAPYKFEFIQDPFHAGRPTIMQDGLGFEASRTLDPGWTIGGRWELMTPLSISSIGQDPIIDKITVQGWKKTEGAIGFQHISRVALVLDQGEQWRKDIQKHGPQAWDINQWTPQIDLANYGNLNIRIYQYLTAPLLGTATYRDGYITVEGTYLTELPPQTYAVNITVIDSQTLTPIQNATVLILSGTQIIAQGKTGYQGQLTIDSVTEGEYTLKTFRTGYVSSEQRLEVTGDTYSSVSLVKALGPDWERYLGYGMVGVGLIVGYKILTAPETGAAYRRAKKEIEKRR